MTAKKGNPRAKALLRRALKAGASLGDVARDLHLDRSTLTHWRDGSTRRIPKPVLDALEMFVIKIEVRKAVAESAPPQETDHEQDRQRSRAQ